MGASDAADHFSNACTLVRTTMLRTIGSGNLIPLNTFTDICYRSI